MSRLPLVATAASGRSSHDADRASVGLNGTRISVAAQGPQGDARDAEEVTIPVGTTVAELAAQLGIPDASRMSALDEMSTSHGPNTRIGEDAQPSTLSFVYKLVGA